MVEAVTEQHKASRSRRVIHVVGAIVVGVLLPATLMGVVVGALGVAAMFVGLLLGVFGSKLGGTNRIAVVSPLIGVAAGAGAFTAYGWSWAVLLACTGVLAGVGIGFGWFATLLMVPFAATFVTPVATGTDAWIYGIVVTIAALYGVALAHRFGIPAVVDGDRLQPSTTAVIAIVFGAVLGLSAAIGVALDWTEPYWVPEPVLILVMYIVTGKRDRIRGKTIGTVLGVAAVLPVALLDPPAGVMAAAGVIAFVLALMQSKTYWRMYGLYTFSLILLLGAPGQVGFEAEERGVQILVGIALLVIGLIIVHAVGTRLATNQPQPELAAPLNTIRA